MKLLDWMRRENVDDAAFASQIGGCSGFAVRKWKYGERRPDPDRIHQIEKLTNGEVTLTDWLSPAPAPDRERAA